MTTPRSNGTISVSSTDVLIAMLSGDLRGSWGPGGRPIRIREHADPAACPAACSPPRVLEEPEPPGPPEELEPPPR